MCKIFHKHQWETIHTENHRIFDDDHKLPVGFRYVEIQRCKICGKIRSQSVRS